MNSKENEPLRTPKKTGSTGSKIIADRSCTDLICCLGYVGFIALCVVIGIYGITQGNTANILAPFDSSKNRCGGEGPLANFPYLQFNSEMSISNPMLGHTVCVAQCPATAEDSVDCYPNKEVKLCNEVVVEETFAMASRFCLPTMASYGPTSQERFSRFDYGLKYLNLAVKIDETNQSPEDKVKAAQNHKTNKKEGIQKFLNEAAKFAEGLQDIADAKWIILLCVGVIFGCSYVYIWLLKQFLWPLVLAMIAGFYVSLGLLGWMQFSKGLQEESDPDAAEFQDEGGWNYKYCAYAIWGLAGLLLLCLLCMCGRISLAISMMNVAGDYITEKCSCIFVPMVASAAALCYILYWMYITAMIYSVGDVGPYLKRDLPFGRMTWQGSTTLYFYIHCFSILWNLATILSISNFVLTLSSTKWYFATDPENKTEDAGIIACTVQTFWYHLGTIAFGSLLISAAWTVEIILSWILAKLQASGQENGPVGFLVKCGLCFVNCLERAVSCLNKQVYVETAITSKGFFASAGAATKILQGNIVRFSTLYVMVEWIMLFSVVGLATLGIWLNKLLLDYFADKTGEIYETFYPLVFSGFLCIVVAKAFTSVYETISGSLLYSYCWDENQHGSAKYSSKGFGEAANAHKKGKASPIRDRLNDPYKEMKNEH